MLPARVEAVGIAGLFQRARERGNNEAGPGILSGMHRSFPSGRHYTTAKGLGVGLLFLLTGCAAVPAQGPAASPLAARAKETPAVEVAPMVVSPYSDGELEQQFEQARVLLLRESYPQAAERFDKLVRLAPAGETAAPSLYNGALAREGMGERVAAVEIYQKLIERFPDHGVTRGAPFRLSRLFAHLERWGDLAANADRILAMKDRSVLETVEAHGAKALGLVEQGHDDEAARQVGLARDLIEQHQLGESGNPPLELAQASFALGEIRRRRSEKIVFDPLPPNFVDVLEQRCQGLLDAQSAYTDAMRSYDAHWSAMAGYRVGQLYQQLHRDVMAIPPTAKSDTLKKKQLFEGTMRLRYRVLLEKGLKMMEGTVRLGQRTGEDSAWVHRAEDAKRDIELALEDEKRALSKLPYSEAELQEALDLLRKKAP
jgi:tetratricopeptide (TPR) repeat protein